VRVVFRKSARRDLLDITAYIGRDAPLRAKSFVGELRSRCLILAEHPNSGSTRYDLFKNLRIVPHGNYIIYYLAHPEKVTILRISHASRLIEATDLSET
jgi:toxin ParE1/3/4